MRRLGLNHTIKKIGSDYFIQPRSWRKEGKLHAGDLVGWGGGGGGRRGGGEERGLEKEKFSERSESVDRREGD